MASTPRPRRTAARQTPAERALPMTVDQRKNKKDAIQLSASSPARKTGGRSRSKRNPPSRTAQSPSDSPIPSAVKPLPRSRIAAPDISATDPSAPPKASATRTTRASARAGIEVDDVSIANPSASDPAAQSDSLASHGRALRSQGTVELPPSEAPLQRPSKRNPYSIVELAIARRDAEEAGEAGNRPSMATPHGRSPDHTPVSVDMDVDMSDDARVESILHPASRPSTRPSTPTLTSGLLDPAKLNCICPGTIIPPSERESTNMDIDQGEHNQTTAATSQLGADGNEYDSDWSADGAERRAQLALRQGNNENNQTTETLPPKSIDGGAPTAEDNSHDSPVRDTERRAELAPRGRRKAHTDGADNDVDMRTDTQEGLASPRNALASPDGWRESSGKSSDDYVPPTPSTSAKTIKPRRQRKMQQRDPPPEPRSSDSEDDTTTREEGPETRSKKRQAPSKASTTKGRVNDDDAAAQRETTKTRTKKHPASSMVPTTEDPASDDDAVPRRRSPKARNKKGPASSKVTGTDKPTEGVNEDEGDGHESGNESDQTHLPGPIPRAIALELAEEGSEFMKRVKERARQLHKPQEAVLEAMGITIPHERDTSIYNKFLCWQKSQEDLSRDDLEVWRKLANERYRNLKEALNSQEWDDESVTRRERAEKVFGLVEEYWNSVKCGEITATDSTGKGSARGRTIVMREGMRLSNLAQIAANMSNVEVIGVVIHMGGNGKPGGQAGIFSSSERARSVFNERGVNVQGIVEYMAAVLTIDRTEPQNDVPLPNAFKSKPVKSVQQRPARDYLRSVIRKMFNELLHTVGVFGEKVQWKRFLPNCVIYGFSLYYWPHCLAHYSVGADDFEPKKLGTALLWLLVHDYMAVHMKPAYEHWLPMVASEVESEAKVPEKNLVRFNREELRKDMEAKRTICLRPWNDDRKAQFEDQTRRGTVPLVISTGKKALFRVRDVSEKTTKSALKSKGKSSSEKADSSPRADRDEATVADADAAAVADADDNVNVHVHTNANADADADADADANANANADDSANAKANADTHARADGPDEEDHDEDGEDMAAIGEGAKGLGDKDLETARTRRGKNKDTRVGSLEKTASIDDVSSDFFSNLPEVRDWDGSEDDDLDDPPETTETAELDQGAGPDSATVPPPSRCAPSQSSYADHTDHLHTRQSMPGRPSQPSNRSHPTPGSAQQPLRAPPSRPALPPQPGEAMPPSSTRTVPVVSMARSAGATTTARGSWPPRGQSGKVPLTHGAAREAGRPPMTTLSSRAGAPSTRGGPLGTRPPPSARSTPAARFPDTRIPPARAPPGPPPHQREGTNMREPVSQAVPGQQPRGWPGPSSARQLQGRQHPHAQVPPGYYGRDEGFPPVFSPYSVYGGPPVPYGYGYPQHPGSGYAPPDGHPMYDIREDHRYHRGLPNMHHQDEWNAWPDEIQMDDGFDNSSSQYEAEQQ
ncbi:hypothetical protein CONPUDRAFT_148216 [Coniophora puteana RWD-64-598 SS2]|uniref:Uncharacterized protein n=1 Tax=Coniophora puteana (strain RWD-64-598) TaxID=741705 RepID=A0A5M3N3Z4_CONPW|nr:uncharacterized protein CONPUDRAFT_148216 [Coniophora puteana RWD-64-598 SS2]EIW86103.1 hypothetical protein CONPUDRAFT_148216 [Coniophora puteana RWD-64-598 SS2]